jgi:hypothetical protein
MGAPPFRRGGPRVVTHLSALPVHPPARSVLSFDAADSAIASVIFTIVFITVLSTSGHYRHNVQQFGICFILPRIQKTLQKTMDDTPDKLRRNVVVLSAAILAIALFNLSFRTNGTLLGFAQVGNVSPFKVWLALTATLLYVLMRYHHSDETKAERAYVAESFCELRRVALIGRIEAAVRRYFLRGAPVALFDDFAEFLDNDIERHMARDGRAKELDDPADRDS